MACRLAWRSVSSASYSRCASARVGILGFPRRVQHRLVTMIYLFSILVIVAVVEEGSRRSARSAAKTNDLEARRATVRMEAEKGTSCPLRVGVLGSVATLLRAE